MNTIWSTYIQNIGTLYESRKLRFSDFQKEKYKNIFQFPETAKILEIGCGPGALAESLCRWYPNAEIFGIDRDSNFIDFAKKNNPTINFMEGDATSLPFDDNSFDVTISNTVAEHIEGLKSASEISPLILTSVSCETDLLECPLVRTELQSSNVETFCGCNFKESSKFYGEQYRVLKDGGVCVVLSARKGINISAPCVTESSDFENEIWNRVGKYYDDAMKKYSVCAYPQSESELPLCMEKYGFKNVATEYITINLTPDNSDCPKETARAMINTNRRNAIDNIESLSSIAPNEVSAEEIEELKRLANKKYDKRIELYDFGVKQWDVNMSLTMIVKGRK